jgi:hypothetical protein
MKTVYDLYHWRNKNAPADVLGTHGTMLDAAAAITDQRPELRRDFVTDPAKWVRTGADNGWTIADWVRDAAGADFSPWGIFERRVPEDDAESIQLALEVIGRYGGIDGDHHKAWVLDQAVRHLTRGQYDAWVAEQCDGEDGPDTYSWDEGIAP